MLTSTAKWLAVAAGWLFLAIGVIGIFVPLLPTTPFVLLSAYLFSIGSKPLHDWLLSRPKIGPLIQDWQNHRVIRPRAKATAVTMITLLFSYTLLFVEVPAWIKGTVATIGVCLVTFILKQRSHRPVSPP